MSEPLGRYNQIGRQIQLFKHGGSTSEPLDSYNQIGRQVQLFKHGSNRATTPSCDIEQEQSYYRAVADLIRRWHRAVTVPELLQSAEARQTHASEQPFQN